MLFSNDKPGDLSRHEPVAVRASVAERIKQTILEQGLKPGDLLPTEAALCEEFDVSRSSVREAIRNLSALGIVDVRHGYGTYVGELSLSPLVEALVFRSALSPEGSLHALREVVEIRLALDLSMAERVVAALTGTNSPDLESIVNEMVRQAKQNESFLDADRAFHTTLFSVIDNKLAAQLVGAFWDIHTAALSILGLPLPSDIELTVHAHTDMLEAARQGDVNGYRLAVIEHYAPLQRALTAAEQSSDA